LIVKLSIKSQTIDCLSLTIDRLESGFSDLALRLTCLNKLLIIGLTWTTFFLTLVIKLNMVIID